MTTTTATLAEFLLARIGEREALARRAHNHRPWTVSSAYGRVDVLRHPYDPGDDMIAEEVDAYDAPHIAANDPAHVLAQCAALREIVERCDAVDYAMPSTHLAHGVLRALAQPYRDHPEWRAEWAS